MKKLLPLLTTLFSIAGITSDPAKVFAQNCINTVGPFSGPARYEVQAPSGNFLCVTAGAGTSPPIDGTLTLPGMGVNQNSPQYMLDILCTTDTKRDVNISCPYSNAVGYRIGGNMVMWHDGDVTSFYLGIGAGFIYTGPLPTRKYGNTFVGYNTGAAFAGTGGTENTAMGYIALAKNSVSNGNTSIGAYALTSFASVESNYNVAIGWSALKTYNPTTANSCVAIGKEALMNEKTNGDNVAIGSQALLRLVSGSQNTAVGNAALQSGLSDGNTAIGFAAMANNTTGPKNTAVGWYAMQGGPNTGEDNTAMGAQALQANTSGSDNTAIGQAAMWLNYKGSNNTAVGMWALYNNTWNPNGSGAFNVALGQGSLFNNYVEDNTATGYYSGYNITRGKGNTANGMEAMFGYASGCTGSYNVATGINSLHSLSSGDSNVGIGAYSLDRSRNANANAALGYNAGASVKSDFDNLFLGARADKNNYYAIHNAAAIGYHAITTSTNQMELGNNNNTITLGLSDQTPGNTTRLEISTQYGSYPFNVTAASRSPRYVNGGSGTGWSGLRFDDLTSNSIPGSNPGKGVLALDGEGNVIYVKDTVTAIANTIGTCTNPTLLTNSNGAINMAGIANFYFLGNDSGTAINNVGIGLPSCSAPQAKLDILQSSGKYSNSIGLSVLNTDNGSPGCFVDSMPNVIGIKSVLSNINGGPKVPGQKVAGWFEAQPALDCQNSTTNQYAIFVPRNGGNVCLGFPWNSLTLGLNNYALLVNGAGANIGGNFTASDSTIKTNVKPLANALTIVKSLNGVSYKYISDIITDSAMAGIHYGFIAQQVGRILPGAVKQIPNPITNTPLVALSYNDIIPWLVEGMKEQEQIKYHDSINQKNKMDSLFATVESLQYEIDSLRNAFIGIQSCLNRLCHDRHEETHNNSGTGNSVDSDATTINVQNIVLSSTNAPLLYQNTPNPFSTGTKINYYLPEGTVGAIMVFYDSYGNQIKIVQLNQAGNGTLNITPDNLANGIYSYSLVVGGSPVDTKRMIIQK